MPGVKGWISRAPIRDNIVERGNEWAFSHDKQDTAKAVTINEKGETMSMQNALDWLDEVLQDGPVNTPSLRRLEKERL